LHEVQRYLQYGHVHDYFVSLFTDYEKRCRQSTDAGTMKPLSSPVYHHDQLEKTIIIVALHHIVIR